MKKPVDTPPTLTYEMGYSNEEILTLADLTLEAIGNDHELGSGGVTSLCDWMSPTSDARVTLSVTASIDGPRFYTLYIESQDSDLNAHYEFSDADSDLDITRLNQDGDPFDWQNATSRIIAGMRIIEQLREFHQGEKEGSKNRLSLSLDSEEASHRFGSAILHIVLEEGINHERILQLGQLDTNDLGLASEVLIGGIQSVQPIFDDPNGALMIRQAINDILNKNSATT